MGIGIDLLEIDRLERALERRPALADRVFRPDEIAYAETRRRPAVHLAARFAAKEAALKALEAQGVPLRDVEVEGGGRHPHACACTGAPRGSRESSASSWMCRSPTRMLTPLPWFRPAPPKRDSRPTAPAASRLRRMEGWLEPIYDAEGMRAADAWAIDERGIPSLELMEAAGGAVAEAAREVAGPGPIRVVCGKGNNGGDGLVAARLLASTGHEVEVLLLWPADELSEDGGANLERLDVGVVRVVAPEEVATALAGSGAIVDAIFGTGFEGAPREPADAAIEAVNGCGAPVVAADIASGVDASSGEVEGVAVQAATTVAFHAGKLGHWIAPGKSHTGKLRVADIGIPPGAPARPAAGVIGDGVLELAPRREPGSTKFTSGEVFVVGGSRGLTGAVCLAATSAARAGAGYATVAVPADLEPIFEVKLTEVMSRGFEGAPGRLDAGDAEAIAEAAKRAAAVVLGPGLGRDEGSLELARALPGLLRSPLLIDADGLNAHACSLESLAGREAPTVLTPHEGELGRLLDRDSREVAAHRLECAREAASRSHAVIVAQGRRHPRRRGRACRRCPRRCPGSRDRGHRRRALRHDRRAPGPRHGAIRGRMCGGQRPSACRAHGGGAPRPRRVRDRGRRGGGDPGGAAMSEQMRASAHIDTGAIARNCATLLGSLSGGSRLCAVVKADGYGHGAVAVAEAALDGGASMLAVAGAEEARELRFGHEESRGSRLDAPILVLGALSSEALRSAIDADCEVSVWDPGFLTAVAEAGAAAGIRPRVHVKYDTGMGRLGARDPAAVRDLVAAAAESEHVELAGLWTHFATADEPGSAFFEAQLARFSELAEELRSAHPALIVHAANSAATLREPASHFDMVRCGIAIYGLDPFHEDATRRKLEPALELRSYVARVARFAHGDGAGYGQTWRAPAPTWVGTLPIGYGDGVRRANTNNGNVVVGGRRYPIVGTVSMDNLTIDLGTETDVEPGDRATLIGAQGGERISCEEVAKRLGTINYEVATQISARVPRIYEGP